MAIVVTHSGPVRGVASGNSFRGIPYAAAPSGALRWKPPVQPDSWSSPWDATRFGPEPMQPRPKSGSCSEDCLTVNVWTPQADRSAKLPVLVWFHGGGFAGGGAFDPANDGASFASQGVVVVSFNYRVGIFGFLAHPELAKESPQSTSGNYGLLDQLAALRWVQQNIEAFGGDPARVVVAGVSAGSASIALLMTSPLAAGLFHAAILQSPGCFRPLALLDEAQAAGNAVGTVAHLRSLQSDELLSAKQPLLVPAMRRLTGPRVLRPIVDGFVIGQQERTAYRQGKFAKVPILVGTNTDEGSTLTRGWSVQGTDELAELIGRSFPHHRERALDLYGTGDPAQVAARVAAMFSDTQFQYGARALAQTSAACQPNTFRYLFTRRKPGRADGPHHTDEVPYAFNNLSSLLPASGTNPADRELSAVMHRAWINFIRSDDPNGNGIPLWPPVGAQARTYMEFGDRVGSASGWREAQLDLIEAHYAVQDAVRA